MRLDSKLLLVFVAVSLALAQLISVSSKRAVHAVLVSNMEAPARVRAYEIGRSMAVGLKPGAEKLLEYYLKGCLGSFGASYAAAVDEKGMIVASESVAGLTRPAGTQVAPAGREPEGRDGEIEGKPVRELLLPSERGSLLLGYDLEEALRTEREIGLKLFVFTGTSGGLALVVLFLLMRDLVRRFDQASADILEHMHDGVFVVGEDGNLRTVNPSLLRTLGYAESELVGRPASVLLGRGAALAPGKANAELRLTRKDGTPVDVLLSTSVLRAGGASPAGIVCAVRDVTELKRKDAELKERELQLRHSDKLSAVGRLAAGIAHEINNPLGSILGFAQAAAARLKPSAALAPALKGIEEEALRCRTLVKSLLAFSRQGKGEHSVLELASAIEATLAMIEAQARVKNVTIARDLDPSVRVRGDRGQLQQVVMNLCVNAIDAMPNGGVLTVRCESLSGGRAVLEVQDEGAGVPKDIRGRIFDPFFTTKDVGQGTGLGLSLVHEIVTRHDGAVEVRDAPYLGALFRVVLPAAA